MEKENQEESRTTIKPNTSIPNTLNKGISRGFSSSFLSKVKINRWQFFVLNLVLTVLVTGTFLYILFEKPTNYIWEALIVLFVIIATNVLRLLRMNDISADTQIKLWKSGNMAFMQDWISWLAPSSSSPSGSLEKVSSFMADRDMRIKTIKRNFLRYVVVYVIIIVVIFIIVLK